MENQKQNPINDSNENVENVKLFYKESLPKMIKTLLVLPMDGILTLLNNKNEKTYFNSIFLIITTALLFVLLPYLIVGEMREYIGFKYFLYIGLWIALSLIFISIFTFIIKSINGKPNFKNEVLTGGLSGIPLSILIIIIFILSFFSDNIKNVISDPSSLISGGIFLGVIIIYTLLMLINIFQQSLKSAKISDGLSFYFSPFGVGLSFYIAFKIISSIL